MTRIHIVGTADTKGAELAFLRDAVSRAGGAPFVIDVGTRAGAIAVDIDAATVAAAHPGGAAAVLGGADRGAAVTAMAEAFSRFAPTLPAGGMLGIGGSGGTSIVAAGMRALPIGVAKLIVSTLASGDTAPFVGISDIAMMPAVTDLGGLNDVSRGVLSRAAAAIVAMAAAPSPAPSGRPALGLTMFGVTTAAVGAVVERLSPAHDCLVFHATGTGGRVMEKLAGDGALAGLLDITTTEICDLLFGGVLAATPDRLDVVARTGLPYVGSVGACDMINFFAPETVPAAFAGRQRIAHNANVTLVRTTPAECAAVGRFIAGKLNRCAGPVRFLLPERGVSALDIAGGPFFDPAADAALFEAIEDHVVTTADRRVVRLPCHINDPAFADAVVAHWQDVRSSRSTR